MGTHATFGVWNEERQCYRVREVRFDGYPAHTGTWLLKHAPTESEALAIIESDDTQGEWFVGGPCWRPYARYEFRDGRWWTTIDIGIGLTTHASAFNVPLDLLLLLGNYGHHVEWDQRIARLADQWRADRPEDFRVVVCRGGEHG